MSDVLIASLEEHLANCLHRAHQAQDAYDVLLHRGTRYARGLAALAAAHDEVAAVYQRHLDVARGSQV